MIAPEQASLLHRLEITVKRAVEELTSGTYRSVFRGRGIEFDEVREYTFDDDVRDIDWNVSARMGGKAYVKKYVEERELVMLLLIDVSASGIFGSHEVSKRETAAELAAMLAMAAGKNGDKVGALFFSDSIELFIPPKSGRNHVLRMMRQILSFESKSVKTDVGLALREAAALLKRRSVVFLLSDLFDEKDYSRDLRILSRRHDVIAVEFFDRIERSWPVNVPVDVEDAETGEMISFAGSNAALEKEFAAAEARKQAVCRQAKVDLLEIPAGGDALKPLVEFFDRRKKRKA